MRVTEALISFELLNNEAQKNCTFTSSGNKDFGNLALLNVQAKDQIPFMTLGLNESELNGELSHFDAKEQTNIAFFSSSVSGESCQFSDVWVQGSLNDKYKFIGITLDFGAYYPKKITIEYYQDDLRILHKTVDEIDNTWIYVDMRASGIDRVKVIFNESWAPYQYANLQEFLFGNIIEWTTNDIISGNIQEETDIVSKIIPNDTFSLTIYSKDDDFNVLNPRGAYSYLLPNQRFKLKQVIYELDNETNEVVRTNEINLGYFYLDTWESLFNKQIKFNLVSPLAQLDKTQYKRGRMYKGTSADNAYEILEGIFKDCGLTKLDYKIDPSLNDIYLSGYIPVCTHKQAIQQVAFVCNCLVFDNRGGPINIRPFDASFYQEIHTTNIFDPIKIERRESVTSLTINVHNFALKLENQEIFKGFLQKGRREIIFTTPCENLKTNSGNIIVTERGINYVILDVKEDGEYTLTGQRYEDKNYKYAKELIDDKTIKRNTIDIDKATLVTSNNVEELAEKLILFYRMYNLTIEFKFISDGQLTGANVVFRDNQSRVFVGAFIRQNLDIGGGFLSNCYLIGYQQIEEEKRDYLYSGKENPPHEAVEIYSGEEYGLI